MCPQHPLRQWIRRTPNAELEIASHIELGTVDTDVAGIEVVRYKAPVLLVKAVSADGTVIQDVKPSASLKSSEKELNFEKQQDGRHRSSQMIPDVSWTVAAEKAGLEVRVPGDLPEGGRGTRSRTDPAARITIG